MWIVLIIIGIVLIYKFGKSSGKAMGRARSDGGMRLKYAKLLTHILEGHKDCRIIAETRTYIRAGVSNYGGSTMFHIQQCPNNTVMIDYDVSNNPVFWQIQLKIHIPR